MDAHHFFALAEMLAGTAKDEPAYPHRAAACRSAVSRAYYAAFLLARQLLDDLGFDTRRVPNPHATFEQAFSNSGVLTLQRLANALRSLCADRTTADYDLRNAAVESYAKVESVLETARAAIVQLDIIRSGRLSPPLDRTATADAILKWAKENSKPLWKKA